MLATSSPCGHASCAAEGADFARVRYFFGQRLTAVDLADEQSYVVGKLRFHHRHLHGMGVLCGLTARRERPVQGDERSTTLRVLRGAAVDCHGREIVVPSDHCLDVGAWFAKRRAGLPEEWKEPGRRNAFVAVRYRDCPSDPVASPRDPCGCTPEGCEYARVREGFELALLATLDDACTERPDAAAARRALEGAEPLECPECGGDCPGWLALARVTVTLAETQGRLHVDRIDEPVHTIPERLTLLPTWALQALAGSAEAAGPRLGPPQPSGRLDAARLSLPVVLAEDDAGAAVALAKVPNHAIVLEVQTLDAQGAVAVVKGTTAFDAAAPAFVWTAIAGTVIQDGATCRLVVVADPARPVVDRHLRALAGAGRAVRFRAGEKADHSFVVTTL